MAAALSVALPSVLSAAFAIARPGLSRIFLIMKNISSIRPIIASIARAIKIGLNENSLFGFSLLLPPPGAAVSSPDADADVPAPCASCDEVSRAAVEEPDCSLAGCAAGCAEGCVVD